VIAGHGNLAKVKDLYQQQPDLLNKAYPWSETDRETALMAASQVGSVPVAEFLLSKGAPLDICTAAMMGHLEEVQAFLSNDPQSIKAKGAHGIPLLAHAALSGNPQLVQFLVQKGATEGVAFALHNAVSRGNFQMTEWILDNGRPDLTWKNYQGKTALVVALERKDSKLADLLRSHGAQ
jgi:uncharacterized protein